MTAVTPKTRFYHLLTATHLPKAETLLYQKILTIYTQLPHLLKAQLNQEEFVDFLSSKCTNVEYY